jgi:integrase
MENSRLRRPAPTSVNVTVGKRSREYLTEREVERLIEAAKQNRCGNRDATAILVAYRHGLRALEIVALRSGQARFGLARSLRHPSAASFPCTAGRQCNFQACSNKARL